MWAPGLGNWFSRYLELRTAPMGYNVRDPNSCLWQHDADEAAGEVGDTMINGDGNDAGNGAEKGGHGGKGGRWWQCRGGRYRAAGVQGTLRSDGRRRL